MDEKEYIEREAVCYQLAKQATIDGQPRAIRRAATIVADFPAADVRPVVRAYWKSVPHKRARVCSRCEADEPYKFADDDANVYNFCPNCGADMRPEPPKEDKP